jgi:hypothetical protein
MRAALEVAMPLRPRSAAPALLFLALLAAAGRAQGADALAASVTPGAPAPEPALAAAGNGLYPLWEQTGLLLDPGAVLVGYAHAQVGLGPVQLGTQPFLDLYGTANVEAKVRLWAGPRTHVALVAGTYRIPTRAEARMIGRLHPTGFSNPYAPLWVMPVSVAQTFFASPRLVLHAATTALATWSTAAVDRQISVGQSVLAELRTRGPWSANLHAGFEGLLVAPQAHVGLSFAYRRGHLALAAGYARRASFEGESAGVWMVDGAVVIP